MDAVEFKERAVALLQNGATKISQDAKLKAELVELCESIGKSIKGGFKTGCKNCIGDGITFISIELNKLKREEMSNTKYILKSNKVVHKGRTLHLNIMTDDQLAKTLADYPELSKIIVLNEKPKATKAVEAVEDVKLETKKK